MQNGEHTLHHSKQFIPLKILKCLKKKLFKSND